MRKNYKVYYKIGMETSGCWFVYELAKKTKNSYYEHVKKVWGHGTKQDAIESAQAFREENKSISL